ncbi:MAG: carboxypeptidase regulatory-like domain-containing protein [Gemmatimonadota bacterium]|nr:MAG: carboxypeptidase regulatory-like domain-containing protein [Gemmatimonadota bacterium]
MKQVSILMMSLVALSTVVVPVNVESATSDTTVFLSGQVTDPGGNPVEGVSIRATDWLNNRQGYGATTEDGIYRITLARGTYILEVSSPWGSELLDRTIFDVEVPSDTNLDIVLETGLTLAGRITYPDSDPAADVHLWLGTGTWQSSASSDSTGAYGFTGLKPETYILEINPAEESGFPCQTITDVNVSEDITLNITLRIGVSVSGWVTDPEGEPVADVSVTVWDENALGRATVHPSGNSCTSIDGNYVINLAAGTYELDIFPPEESGLPRQSISTVQVTGDTTLDVELKAGVVLSGCVSDTDGETLEGFLVTAHKLPTNVHWPWGTFMTETASDGTYQLMVIEGNTYDVTFGTYIGDDGVLSGRRVSNIEMDQDRTLDITLAPLYESFEVRGIIRDNYGQPMSEVYISAYESTTGNFSCIITYLGMYWLVLPAGTYSFTLVSFLPGGESTEQYIENVVVEEDMIKNITIDISTAVEEEVGSSGIPRTFILYQNYPNPFNARTTIGYELTRACKVRLTIYNVLGQKVKTLVDEPKDAGYYTVTWDGWDHFGKDVASGIYFYRLKAGTFTQSRRMLLLK